MHCQIVMLMDCDDLTLIMLRTLTLLKNDVNPFLAPSSDRRMRAGSRRSRHDRTAL
jgi:hypothetical protein